MWVLQFKALNRDKHKGNCPSVFVKYPHFSTNICVSIFHNGIQMRIDVLLFYSFLMGLIMFFLSQVCPVYKIFPSHTSLFIKRTAYCTQRFNLLQIQYELLYEAPPPL